MRSHRSIAALTALIAIILPLTALAEEPAAGSTAPDAALEEPALRATLTLSEEERATLHVRFAPGFSLNLRAPPAQRLTLELTSESARFDVTHFTLDDSGATLTWQPTAPPEGLLTAMICRAEECRTEQLLIAWSAPTTPPPDDDHSTAPPVIIEPVETTPATQPATPAEVLSDELEELDLLDDMVTEVVVTTATRRDELGADAVRTQTTSRQQLEQRQARDVTDAVLYMSGVRVENNCQSCGFTQLRLNGLGGAYNQILIDGQPTLSGLAGVYGLEQFPASMWERVEVIKGSGEARYAPNAVSGVVNLVTRRPTENTMSATIAHEQLAIRTPEQRVSAEGSVVSASGATTAQLFAATRRRAGLDLNDDAITELPQLRQLSAGALLAWSPDASRELRLTLHTLREARRGGDQLDLPPHDANVAEELNTERVHGELRWRHAVSDHVSYALSYTMAHTDRRSYYGGRFGAPRFEPPAEGEPLSEEAREALEAERAALGAYGRTLNPLHVADAQLNLDYTARGAQRVSVGGQLIRDAISDNYLVYDRRNEATYTTLGAYAQHTWEFNERVTSQVGARLDQHSELTAPIASPRAALLVKPTAETRLRTALSTGWRAPQVFDEDLHIELVGGEARFIVNAPDLKPERSQNVSQQVAHRFTLSEAARLTLSASGFATRLQDAFVLNTSLHADAPQSELVRSNRGTTRVLGGELEGELNARWWALRAGWTFEDARNEEPDDDFLQRRILRTPRHYGYMDVLVQRSGFQAQSGVTCTGPMLVPRYDADGEPLEVNTSPWFFDWSINMSYALLTRDLLAVEPFIGVRNILDARQRDLESGFERDASYFYGPLQPRTALIGVRGTL